MRRGTSKNITGPFAKKKAARQNQLPTSSLGLRYLDAFCITYLCGNVLQAIVDSTPLIPRSSMYTFGSASRESTRSNIIYEAIVLLSRLLCAAIVNRLEETRRQHCVARGCVPATLFFTATQLHRRVADHALTVIFGASIQYGSRSCCEGSHNFSPMTVYSYADAQLRLT